MQTGTKTPKPVSKEEAEKIATKLVSGKLAKGYTVEADGTPYRSSGDEGRDTGIRYQLLNPVEEDQVPLLLRNSRHVMQEKHDGRRLLVRKQGDEIIGINRRGLIVSLPATIDAAAREIPVDFLIDGEAVGDILHAFDLLEVGGIDVRQRGYFDRFTGLLRVLGDSSSIHPVRTFVESKEKQEEFNRLLQAGVEGVVFKDRDAWFNPGRPASGGSQLKFKFVATASFIVGAVNKRRSVSLLLLDGAREVPAGNVTIPPSMVMPGEGNIVEVRYLYPFKGSGSVYQPVFLGVRNDLERSECHVDQLKFKSSEEVLV